MKNEISKIITGSLGGFGLAGTRLKNGKVELVHSKEIIDNWPAELPLAGHVYTLENVHKFKKSDKGQFENADYV